MPGYVVDSSTTVQPRRTRGPRRVAACAMWERSGIPSFRGVGTVMTAVSNSPRSVGLGDWVIPTCCQRPGHLGVGHVVNVRSTLA